MDALIGLAVAFAGLGVVAFTVGYAPSWISSLFSKFAEMD